MVDRKAFCTYVARQMFLKLHQTSTNSPGRLDRRDAANHGWLFCIITTIFHRWEGGGPLCHLILILPCHASLLSLDPLFHTFTFVDFFLRLIATAAAASFFPSRSSMLLMAARYLPIQFSPVLASNLISMRGFPSSCAVPKM